MNNRKFYVSIYIKIISIVAVFVVKPFVSMRHNLNADSVGKSITLGNTWHLGASNKTTMCHDYAYLQRVRPKRIYRRLIQSLVRPLIIGRKVSIIETL